MKSGPRKTAAFQTRRFVCWADRQKASSPGFPAVPVLDFLTQRFPQENITIVTAEQDYQTMRMLPHTTLMRMLVSEVNPLLLPRKDIVQRVLGREYDLAIDLNLDLVLPSAYICRASKARVRIGFARKHADFFYNLAINVDPAHDRKQVYDILVRCLQMF